MRFLVKEKIPYVKTYEENGITLISLAITIAIILILTSATVRIAIGDGGIIQTAKEVKKEQQMEIYKTQIEILITNWNLKKAMNDTITIDNLWDKLQQEGIIENPDTDISDKGNGNYIIKTKEGELEININLEGISSGELQGKITSVTEWNSNNGTASVTLLTTQQGVTLQYKVSGVDTEYKDYMAPISITDLTKDTVIIAQTVNENDEVVNTANIVVRDAEAPAQATVELSGTTTTVNQTITATVTHTDSKSGINLENCKWEYNTESGNIGTDASKYTGTFDSNPDTISLTATKNETYYLHILSVDRAGNATETKITVPNNTVVAEGITLNQTQATLEEGESITLTATISPDSTTNKTFTWKSSAPSVATVSTEEGTSGVAITVNAISKGNATITATTSNGKKATCEITVTAKQVATVEGLIGKEASDTNTYTQDKYGNKIVVPANFTVVANGIDGVVYDYDTESGTTTNIPVVQDGIVIEDSEGNQFVWVPIGEITNSDGSITNIKLGRYEDFTMDTTTTPPTPPDPKQLAENWATNDSTISIDLCRERVESTSKHTTSYNLEDWVTSTLANNGYYIARYEASYGIDGKANSKPSTGTPSSSTGSAPTTEGQLWNYITQPDAATASRNMYPATTGANYYSDLVNSYAWDTATIFIQAYSGNATYASEKSSYKDTSSPYQPANTGERIDGTTEKVCNIYDMASNVRECTTEYYYSGVSSYVVRGGGYNMNSFYTSLRGCGFTSTSNHGIAFRPALYVSSTTD